MPPMAAALAVAALLAIGAASAQRSVLRLRNGTLSIQPGAGNDTQAERDAEQVVLFSLGRGGAGRYERADYASAYTDQNTLELVGGVNPLESSATVEANNSYILVNASASSSPLTALELILQENNTLSVEGAVLDLRRSTLRAVKSNWLLFTNGSTLALGNSRLDLSDWFTWLLEDSSLDASDSVLSTRNFIVAWNRSAVTLTNVTRRSTASRGRSGRGPESRYEGKLSPITYIKLSTVNASKTTWDVDNAAVWHVHNSSLSLRNSTLVLRNTLGGYIRSSALALDNSEVRIENSTLVLGELSSTLNVTGVVVRGGRARGGGGGEGEGNATQAAQALVGFPLGSVPLDLVDADADIYVEEGAGGSSTAGL